jgi:hypothetical protein
MSDEFSAVQFDGDEAVAEALAGLGEARSTRGGLFRGAGAVAGAGARRRSCQASPAPATAAARRTTSRSSTTR